MGEEDNRRYSSLIACDWRLKMAQTVEQVSARAQIKPNRGSRSSDAVNLTTIKHELKSFQIITQGASDAEASAGSLQCDMIPSERPGTSSS